MPEEYNRKGKLVPTLCNKVNKCDSTQCRSHGTFKCLNKYKLGEI